MAAVANLNFDFCRDSIPDTDPSLNNFGAI